MEKELNVKEWLDKETEGYFQLYSDCKYEEANYNDFISVFERYLEKYANYKNRILEGKILQFRQTVKNTIQPIQVEEYDEYFGIQTTREGRIQ